MKTRLPWLTLTVAAAAIAVHLLPSTADWLHYDRAALGRGEFWRLFTAHITHFGANHLSWDLGVWLAFGAVCERQSRTRCAVALGVSAGAITTALWLWQPQFTIYRGLSGVDCALVGLLAASLLRSGRGIEISSGAFVLLGFAAKCVFELATAYTVFATGDGYVPVPLAHLVGLLAGLAAAFVPAQFVTHSSRPRREIVALAR